MPAARSLGALVAVAGGLLVLLGVLLAAGALSWFGRLPGDIRIERGHVQIFVPIATMIVLSVVLSALLGLLQRLFGGR